jgi:protein disulfide-isomerase A1
VFVDNDSAATPAILAEVADAAKDFKGQVSIVKLDGVRWGEHAKHFGLSGKLPGIVAEDRTNNKNYVFPEDKEVKAADLKAHLKGFTEGTLVATLKTQEEPATQPNAVYTLVGKSFERIVLDDSKDVFVEFYAPWCGHCKSLAPKYEQLAKGLAEHKSIVIAQIDSTENDTPASVQGFPTLIFYPAGDKTNPVTYEGDRSVDAMHEFVIKNAKTLTEEQKSSVAPPAAEAPTHEEL